MILFNRNPCFDIHSLEINWWLRWFHGKDRFVPRVCVVANLLWWSEQLLRVRLEFICSWQLRLKCDDISAMRSTPMSVVDETGKLGKSLLEFMNWLDCGIFHKAPDPDHGMCRSIDGRLFSCFGERHCCGQNFWLNVDLLVGGRLWTRILVMIEALFLVRPRSYWSFGYVGAKRFNDLFGCPSMLPKPKKKLLAVQNAPWSLLVEEPHQRFFCHKQTTKSCLPTRIKSDGLTFLLTIQFNSSHPIPLNLHPSIPGDWSDGPLKTSCWVYEMCGINYRP